MLVSISFWRWPSRSSASVRNSALLRRSASLLRAVKVSRSEASASSSKRRCSSRFWRSDVRRVSAWVLRSCSAARSRRRATTSCVRSVSWPRCSPSSVSSSMMRASSSRRRARARASKCARATSQAKTAPRTRPIATSVGSGTPPFPVPADRLEAARRADARVATIEAVARHPLVAEREVELHRVGGVDLSEPRRDLLGHLPVARAAARETDRPTDVLDMRVDRHEEPRRRDGGPEAEVGRFAADHPAQEKLQPLAGPAGRGKRKEMTIAPRDPAAWEHLAQVGLQERPREPLERRPDRADRGGVGGQEALLERAVAQEEIAAGDAERD